MRFTSAGFQPESQRPPGTLIRLTSLDSHQSSQEDSHGIEACNLGPRHCLAAGRPRDRVGADTAAGRRASSEGTAAPGATGTKMKKSSKKSSSKSAMKSKKGAAAPGADSGTGSERK